MCFIYLVHASIRGDACVGLVCVCGKHYRSYMRGLRPDFTSKLVHGLAFGTSKFYLAAYGKINTGLVNQSSNCDVKSGFRSIKTTSLGPH